MQRWDSVSSLLRNPRRGVELGAHSGKFTEHLLAAFPKLTMVAVDTWCSRPGYESYDFADIRRLFAERTRPFMHRLAVLEMETVDAAGTVVDGSVDFVFIDADHAHEAVAADIDAWRPKVKPGGILCGHDYGHPRFPGVARAVDERFSVGTLPDNVWWIRC